ncbi:hypothetical protein [Kribbella shirazensis]|jgi:hypothetical protein|uniref:Uncharacterized protein n=1 Tax=Kribbella shirazensis TaxID=1105143 RepID=A0A7X6A1F0_9ACTN|nr:hypothetical protein [Kribbella shirazensis]NIK57785.1 hypothetical protein [Kribbella shirazensis]
MTEPPVDQDTYRLDHVALPAHVHIRIDGEWRSGWLIACDRQVSGWHGLVQYQDDDRPETTVWLPAEEISAG